MTDPSHADILKDIGRLQGEMASVHREMSNLRTVNATLATEVKTLNGYLSEIRGGKRYVLGLIGVSATISSIITAVASWWQWAPK